MSRGTVQSRHTRWSVNVHTFPSKVNPRTPQTSHGTARLSSLLATKDRRRKARG